MPEGLTGKVAVVAGATGNVGSGIVKILLSHGMIVHALSRSQEKLNALHEYINHKNLHLTLLPHFTQATVAKTLAEIPKVDIAVSSLGAWVENTILAELPQQLWDEMVLSNLSSHFYFCSAALMRLREQRGGKLVMINGEAALSPMPGSGIVSTLDAAQDMMAKVFRSEHESEHIHVHQLVICTPVISRSRPQGENGWQRAEDIGEVTAAIAAGNEKKSVILLKAKS